MALEDFDSDYSSYTKKAKAILSQGPQLESFEERKDETVFPAETWKAIHHGKYQTQWRGMLLLKDPLSLVIYQQLMWDLKPRTIIEVGAYSGASAVWMADTMKAYGCDSHVYSMDIDFTFLEPLAKEERSDITFVEGDCFKIEKALTPDLLKSLPHPWFVSEDAHSNVVSVLHYLDQFTQPGDYVVVEDTNYNIPRILGAGLLDDVQYETCRGEKLNDLKAFMKDHSDRYRVDKRYADFFGYNGSGNMNSFLRRI